MSRPEEKSAGGPEPGDREEFAGMPRWVKILGIVVVMLVVIMIAAHLAGRGGPSHSGSSSVITSVVGGSASW
jgi:hypothetical protein